MHADEFFITLPEEQNVEEVMQKNGFSPLLCFVYWLLCDAHQQYIIAINIYFGLLVQLSHSTLLNTNNCQDSLHLFSGSPASARIKT